ncbi:hypothetical protein [Novosphingobium fuchskuhlense]|uniref:hypothetical protein n=1 Tax=Novosphingobium fuchskuhlense TaxID=1117702 RepID=UPI0012E3C821|nr:hypothetical protein [Novosphingobium fuchskuhlense]
MELLFFLAVGAIAAAIALRMFGRPLPALGCALLAGASVGLVPAVAVGIFFAAFSLDEATGWRFVQVFGGVTLAIFALLSLTGGAVSVLIWKWRKN